MRAKFPKIIVLLVLLPAFLTIGVSEGLGFSWCYGDDGHVELELASPDGCGDNASKQEAAPHCDEKAGLTSDEDHCGPCLDFAIESGAPLASKRLEKQTPPAIDIATLISQRPTLSTNSKTVVNNLAPQPPPRISQTILTHRTVVLLN
jgi:hypothetical protein